MPGDSQQEHFFNEGYILTKKGDGIEIRTSSYHAEPLYLSQSQLAEIGLDSLESTPPLGVTPNDNAALRESILASLEAAIVLFGRQRGKKKRLLHIENLRAANQLVGGLTAFDFSSIMPKSRSKQVRINQ